jgi:hypothetical protein
LRNAARAIEHRPEHHLFLVQGAPHSNFGAEAPHADPKRSEGEMRDGAVQLSGLGLHDLNI